MRSRTWVSPTFAREYIEKHGNGNDNCEFCTLLNRWMRIKANKWLKVTFSPEDIEEFKNNHEAYQKFRKGMVSSMHVKGIS
jgi:hypothetical protein